MRSCPTPASRRTVSESVSGSVPAWTGFQYEAPSRATSQAATTVLPTSVSVPVTKKPCTICPSLGGSSQAKARQYRPIPARQRGVDGGAPFGRHSWPMRRLLVVLAFTVFAAFAPQGLAAKTLRMAYDSDPTSLDPHEQLSGATLQMSHLLFDPLIRFRHDFSLEPRLANSFEKIDERTTRFHLREGVKFQSGRTLSAEDVVWTFNRLKQSPDFKALFEPFTEARAIDDLTVDLVTEGPYPLVLNLATYIFPIDRAFYSGTDEHGKAKDAIVKHGASFASTHASGTGPFIVTEREQGVRLNLKRFADYWDKDSPGNVDDIVFTPIKEPATRVAALLAGDVDFIGPVPPTDLERLRQASCCTLVTLPSPRVLTFELNQDRVPALKDKRVRLAIAYAVDRLCREQRRHRQQDHARARHRGRPVEPARLRRPRSRARAPLRPRQGQGFDAGGRLRRRLHRDDDGAQQSLHRGRARRRGRGRHA